MNRTRPFRRRAALALLLLLMGASGCQSLSFPWSSSRGLPAQWEPAVEGASK